MATPQFTCKLYWDTATYNRGRLKLVKCETDGVVDNDPYVVRLEKGGAPFAIHEAQKAALTVNTRATIKMKGQGFLYMDVGCWLHGHQSFGVICGNAALVASYDPDADAALPPSNDKEGLLRDFLAMKGVQATPELYQDIPIAGGMYEGDPLHLQVIIPDTHIPEAPVPNPEAERIWNWYQHVHYHPGSRTQAQDARQQRDIFGSLQSVDALCSFLERLLTFHATAKKRYPGAKISLVQIGDLYELWAGRECLFLDTVEASVTLAPPEDLTKSKLATWIAATHLMHPKLFAAMDRCVNELDDCTFLHGNHDSYLSVPEVVAAANQLLPGMLGEMQMLESFDIPVTTVFQRQKELFRKDSASRSGIFFEHGQRADSSNRDGHTSGHSSTNSAIDHPFLKRFDSTRRRTFVNGAVAMALFRQGDFSVYVMGHTHEPMLKPVQILHYTADGVRIPDHNVVMEAGAVY